MTLGKIAKGWLVGRAILESLRDGLDERTAVRVESYE